MPAKKAETLYIHIRRGLEGEGLCRACLTFAEHSQNGPACHG